MSDFQSFLDQNLLNIEITKSDEQEYGLDYDIYVEIREMVHEARIASGMTQKQLAERTGLTQSNISNIEKGVSRPTIGSMKKIADAFGKRLVIRLSDREELI